MKNDGFPVPSQVSAAELGGHAFFARMEQAFLQRLAPFAKQQFWEKETYLAHEGERAHAFYLIQSGLVSIETFEPGRKQLFIQTLHENDVVGWSWILPPHEWVFDARALTVVRGISLDAQGVRQAMEQDHELGFQVLERLLRVMAARIKSSRLQLLDLFAQSRR